MKIINRDLWKKRGASFRKGTLYGTQNDEGGVGLKEANYIQQFSNLRSLQYQEKIK